MSGIWEANHIVETVQGQEYRNGSWIDDGMTAFTLTLAPWELNWILTIENRQTGKNRQWVFSNLEKGKTALAKKIDKCLVKARY